jgi:CDP-paratose 2-epimerase
MKVLITGGAGFIGYHLAAALLERGDVVTILDNLSRPRVHHNVAALQTRQTERLRVLQADIRDRHAVYAAIRDQDVVYHLAAQVAVTESVHNPRHDFEINALGTLNVLEAARRADPSPVVVYASTNKVYGALDGVQIKAEPTRYGYRNLPLGVPETQPLDFHSPYGCSKGSADQYVRDYARIYGLKTIVFRQSCVYGPHQFGIEDQGWAAYFAIAAITGNPITIYGDGRQVRDMLYIDDLIVAYRLAIEALATTSGQIYNIGGGPANALSIWAEFGPLLEDAVHHAVSVKYAGWRPGDQLVYVSDVRKAQHDFGWEPQVSVGDGITKLVNWVDNHRELIEEPPKLD